MGKITKNMKITILVAASALFVFAFLYLFTTDLYLGSMGWPYNDPYYPRAFGINLLTLAIFLTISFFRNEWTQAKILIEIVIVWATLILTANIIEICIISLPIGVILTTLNNSIFILVLTMVLFYFYKKERTSSKF